MVPRRVYDVVKKSDEFTSVGFPAQRVKVRNSSPVYRSLDKTAVQIIKWTQDDDSVPFLRNLIKPVISLRQNPLFYAWSTYSLNN